MEQIYSVPLDELPAKQVIVTDPGWSLCDMHQITFKEGEILNVTGAWLFKYADSDDGSTHLGTFWAVDVDKPNRWSGPMSITISQSNARYFAWHTTSHRTKGKDKWPPGDQLRLNLATRSALLGFDTLPR